jgi:hypothetical protein
LDIEAMPGNIRILRRHIVSRGNGLFVRFAIERKRFDGRVQSLARKIYDPGDRAAICPTIRAARVSFSRVSFASPLFRDAAMKT